MEITPLASGSSGNAHLITDSDEQILIEAGIRWRRIQIKMGFRTSTLKAVLMSHAHQDHCKAASAAMRAGVDVYMSQGAAEEAGLSGHRLHHLQPDDITEIGRWRVLPFEVEHDAVEPLGFCVGSPSKECLLYLTDTSHLPDTFDGLTHLMMEANHDRITMEKSGTKPFMKERIQNNHMSLATLLDALEGLDLSRVEEIWLLHMSEERADPERIKREIRRATGIPVKIAHDFDSRP